MNIQSIKFADSFRLAIMHTVREMLANKEQYRAVDSLDSFIVSFNDSYNSNLFSVFSGDELGFADIDQVFLFLKES